MYSIAVWVFVYTRGICDCVYICVMSVAAVSVYMCFICSVDYVHLESSIVPTQRHFLCWHLAPPGSESSCPHGDPGSLPSVFSPLVPFYLGST